MKKPVILAAAVLVASSCATTNLEQEKEIAELRAQVEQLKAELANAKAQEKRPETGHAALYRQALGLEAEGRNAEAVKLYERAARSGSGKAALRLAEIYDKGIPGVSRDYAQSLKWYNAARVLGEEVPLVGARGDPAQAYEQARTLEREGRGAEAVQAYVRAARWGHGKAAKRLGEIYESGIPGVAPNFDESLRWYNAARALGEDVPIVRRLTM